MLDKALALVAYLRAHCPWDREQTALSLVPHLIEETQEVVDAIHADDPSALCQELGDLLLNLAFQVVVAEEEGRFTRDDVVRLLQEKMVRRHPDLFGGQHEGWEAIKARERTGTAPEHAETSTLDGLAQGLDPLLRAHRIQERVAGVGFDWDEASGALAKVREELIEVEHEMGTGDRATLSAEIGDLLFAVVNLARLSGAHAVTSLEAANVKFQRRFRTLEALAKERGVPMPGSPLSGLDALWDEVKRDEVKRGEDPGANRPGD
ncbi:MAG: nucleoside triphosphate pyrophosphohydrolase [Gemmatimonadetes bacterium]|nr:nucleoside triphosphate pyrophosphohydrolase [Gemmatimonadota bacterium]